jgi:hypothetical protein
MRHWPSLLAAVGAAAPLAAQGVGDVAELCAGAGDPADRAWCTEIALGVQAAQGDVALLSSGGAALPGAVSTLGKRVGSSPRLSFSGRLALVGFEAPDLSDPTVVPAPGASALAPALHGAFGIGLFRGFSPSPTVGGLLALDVLATGSALFPPGSLGYSGSKLGYGLGLRLGVFRESFTLPGITLSVTQRWVQDLRFSGIGPDDDAAELGLSTTSLRALIGKDLWGLGFIGGLGWDRSSSDGTVPTADGGTATFDDFTNGRGLLFVGASWSYFLIQLSGEGGWASGWSAPDGRGAGGYDPGSGRWFAGLAFRLIY